MAMTSSNTTNTHRREGEPGLSVLTWSAIALVVIGALNWGLIGLFAFDLVAAIFGELSIPSRMVYVLVALAGGYLLVEAVRVGEGNRVRPRTG